MSITHNRPADGSFSGTGGTSWNEPHLVGNGTITVAMLAFNFVFQEVPSGTQNGVNAAFTLAHSPANNSTQLFLDGLQQLVGTDFNITANAITYTGNGPLSTQKQWCNYIW